MNPVFLADFSVSFRYAKRHMQMKHSLSIFSALMLGIAPAAIAQDDDNQTHVDIGATVLLRPAYVGSDRTKTNILPYLGVDNFHGIDLLGPELKATFIDIGTGRGIGKWSVRAGPRVAFDFGRDSSDSSTLDGLEDINASAVFGGFLRTSYSAIGFDLSVGQDVIGGHDGFVADASIGTRYPGNGWYIQPAVTLSWADENYTQTVYGITSTQAQSSALGEFNTSSGFHQISANIIGGFALNENWNVTAVFSYREALGEYRDSPIIQAEDGSASGIFTSLSVSRRFSFR